MTEKDEPRDSGTEQSVPRGRPRERWLTGQSFEGWMDEVIRRAEAEGQFSNLPGQGKPLPQTHPFESLDESALGHHILKQAGFLPDWLELRKEIEAERPAVVADLQHYREAHDNVDGNAPADAAALRRLADRYLTLAREINKKIDEHNYRRPGALPEIIRFREDAVDGGQAGG